MEARVGTWNLENLFLPDGQFGPPPAVFEQKLHGLAGTITRMAPDLLGVQEVGSPEALQQLVALLDGDWHVETCKHFEGRHPIRVGFLSRHPIEVVDDLRVFPAGLAPVQVSDPARTAPWPAPPRPGGARWRCGSPRPAAGRCR